MKRIKNKLNIIPVALLMLMNSCDLDTVPTTSVNTDTVYSNLDNVDYVLNGTWSYIFETFNTYASPGWTTLMLVNDFMGGDVVEVGNYGYSGVYRYTIMNNNTSVHVANIWRLAYKTIDNMNNIITQIDGIDGDDGKRTRIKAQAHAFRGYMYLTLATHYVHCYAHNPNELCAPIYLEPTNNSTPGKPRSTLTEVYKQAEDDLLYGYNNIGTYSRSAKYKIDKNVISGLMARLHLQKNEWANAQKYAAEAQEGYAWMAQGDYLTGFNDLGNAEWIWGQGSSTDQSNACYSFHYRDVTSTSSYYYSMMADPYFMDLFHEDEGDIRYQLFQWQTGSRGTGYLMYKKFLFKDDGTGDLVVMRKAEMQLIEAEAWAEQDNLAQAITELNELRSARGAQTPDLSGLSKEELIEEILIERRKELFGEGFYLSDIKRRQNKVVRKPYPDDEFVPGSTTIKKKGHDITVENLPNGVPHAANSPYYVFEIPATEVTNNPNL